MVQFKMIRQQEEMYMTENLICNEPLIRDTPADTDVVR